MQRDTAQNWVDKAVGLVKLPESSSLNLQNSWNLLAGYLLQASRLDQPALFLDQVDWLRTVMSARGGLNSDIDLGIRALGKAVRSEFDPELSQRVDEMIETAINNSIPRYQSESHLDEAGPFKSLATDYLKSLISGDRNQANQLILDRVENGTDVRDIYLNVLQPVLREVGRLWSTNKLSVATEHYVSAATQLTMSRLYNHIFSSERSGRVAVACCVCHEQHEIGLRMVADFYEMEGWDTFYLGGNVPAQDVVTSVELHQPELLLLSVSAVSLLNSCTDIVESVRAASQTPVSVVVGGLAFLGSDALWRDVGADGYAGNARDAVSVGIELAGDR